MQGGTPSDLCPLGGELIGGGLEGQGDGQGQQLVQAGDAGHTEAGVGLSCKKVTSDGECSTRPCSPPGAPSPPQPRPPGIKRLSPSLAAIATLFLTHHFLRSTS